MSKTKTIETDLARRSDLRYRALADPTRRHLLRLLDDHGEATDAATLAEEVGLHVNTVRGHLKVLEEAGLVERALENRARPGRPRVLFGATAPDTRSPTTRGYRFLAEVLASAIQATAADPGAVAEKAAAAWGGYLTGPLPPFISIDAGQAIDRTMASLAELGFDPELARQGETVVVQLHDCPFREMARLRGSIVCSVHKGLMQGMLEHLGSPLRVEALEAFVEPSLCLLRLG